MNNTKWPQQTVCICVCGGGYNSFRKEYELESGRKTWEKVQGDR